MINGDGAKWITSCRHYFQHNAIFVIDRFHVARDVQCIFRDHPRYRSIRKKLAAYDASGFMVELNSVIGTIGNEEKEEQLEALIAQLSEYPEALEDYREKLKVKGIDTTGFRPMGSGEGTMSVFAKRLKNGRSWCKKGIIKLSDIIVLMDGNDINTLQGKLTLIANVAQKEEREKPPKHFSEASPQPMAAAEALEPYLIDEPWPEFTYTEDETKVLSSAGADIERYTGEMADKFITGDVPFSEWDKYKKTIDSMGLEEYMEIQTEAYSRYSEN